MAFITPLITSYGAGADLYARRSEGFTEHTLATGFSVAAGATANIVDFSLHRARFPLGCSVMCIYNDGSGVIGQAAFSINATTGAVVFGQQSAVFSETGVTASLLNSVGSILNVTVTGKTTTTSGSALLIRTS